MKGIFRRGLSYYYQPPQVNKERPPMVALQTTDFQEAIVAAAEVRKSPSIAPSGAILAEIKAHLARREKRKEYTRSTAKNKFWVLQAWSDAYPKKFGLDGIHTDQLQAYYDEVVAKYTVQTAHKHLMTIRAFLNDAVEQKKLRRNPATAVKELELPESARALFCNRELRDRLIEQCPREDLQYVLMCGFHAGFRKNEIIESVPWWFNVDLGFIDLRSTPNLRFTNKKRSRPVPLRKIFADFLEYYGLRDPFMLQPAKVKRGKGLYRYDFAKPFSDYMNAQDVPWVTPHVMRHTFASLLVIGGKSIFKVAKWLGDSVTVTEEVYAHLAPADSEIEEDDEPLGVDSAGNPSS